MVSQTIEIGQRFGSLEVLAVTGGRGATFLCSCDCGDKITVIKSNLLRGKVKTCGCLSGKKLLKVGEKFGKLTITAHHISQGHRRMWPCKCECGNTAMVSTKALRNGHTKSCGCLVLTQEGKSKSKMYSTWRGIKRRTRDPKYAGYAHYGAKGIQMCDRWFNSFAAFCEDMGTKPTEQHSIDRINGDGNYEPGNCRWATAETQNQNRREYNTRLTFNGKTQTIAEWSRELGIGQTTITQRLYSYGYSVERALGEPVKKRNNIGITFQDRTQSLRAWEKECGLGRGVLKARINAGWSVGAALGLADAPSKNPVKFNPAALAAHM